MESGLKKDLVRVQVPDARHHILAQQQGFEGAAAVSQDSAEGLKAEAPAERLRAHPHQRRNGPDRPRRQQIDVPKPPLIGEAHLVTAALGAFGVVQPENDPGVATHRGMRGHDLHVASHPQVHQEDQTRVQPDEEILPAPVHAGDAASPQPPKEPGG
jgi:hypothetical protein